MYYEQSLFGSRIRGEDRKIFEERVARASGKAARRARAPAALPLARATRSPNVLLSQFYFLRSSPLILEEKRLRAV